jgi:hypothetical protein
MLTVWTVDSQEGQQVASQVHKQPPRKTGLFASRDAASHGWEPLFGEAGRIMPQDEEMRAAFQ